MSYTKFLRAALLTACLGSAWHNPAFAQRPANLDDLIRQGYQYTPQANKCGSISCDFYVNGLINKDTTEKLRQFLKKRPPGTYLTVWFDSFGGDIDAAMTFGRMLRDQGPASASVFWGYLRERLCVGPCGRYFKKHKGSENWNPSTIFDLSGRTITSQP